MKGVGAAVGHDYCIVVHTIGDESPAIGILAAGTRPLSGDIVHILGSGHKTGECDRRTGGGYCGEIVFRTAVVYLPSWIGE